MTTSTKDLDPKTLIELYNKHFTGKKIGYDLEVREWMHPAYSATIKSFELKDVYTMIVHADPVSLWFHSAGIWGLLTDGECKGTMLFNIEIDGMPFSKTIEVIADREEATKGLKLVQVWQLVS